MEAVLKLIQLKVPTACYHWFTFKLDLMIWSPLHDSMVYNPWDLSSDNMTWTRSFDWQFLYVIQHETCNKLDACKDEVNVKITYDIALRTYVLVCQAGLFYCTRLTYVWVGKWPVKYQYFQMLNDQNVKVLFSISTWWMALQTGVSFNPIKGSRCFLEQEI